jgi:hypothetical protein
LNSPPLRRGILSLSDERVKRKVVEGVLGQATNWKWNRRIENVPEGFNPFQLWGRAAWVR